MPNDTNPNNDGFPWLIMELHISIVMIHDSNMDLYRLFMEPHISPVEIHSWNMELNN